MLDEIFQVSLNGSVSEKLMKIPFQLQYVQVWCRNPSRFFYWIQSGSQMRFAVQNSVGTESKRMENVYIIILCISFC